MNNKLLINNELQDRKEAYSTICRITGNRLEKYPPKNFKGNEM